VEAGRPVQGSHGALDCRLPSDLQELSRRMLWPAYAASMLAPLWHACMIVTMHDP